MQIRSVAELTNVDFPAWTDLVEGWIVEATVAVEVLPVDRNAASRSLHALQVTTRSPLGALAYSCGGILVEHGWVRILGGGHEDLPSIPEATGLGEPTVGSRPVPYVIVGYDVLGGRFAIDGGGLGLAQGKVCYWAPDTLSWEATDLGHGDWLYACLNGMGEQFYSDWRWDGWAEEIAGVPPVQGMSWYPPPFTKEGKDLAAVSRRPVPFTELIGLYDDAAMELADIPDGGRIVLKIT